MYQSLSSAPSAEQQQGTTYTDSIDAQCEREAQAIAWGVAEGLWPAPASAAQRRDERVVRRVRFPRAASVRFAQRIAHANAAELGDLARKMVKRFEITTTRDRARRAARAAQRRRLLIDL